MKNIVNNLMAASLVMMAALTSCDRDKPEQTGQIAVNLKTNIVSSTLKVANDQWEADDKVGLIMKKAGQSVYAQGAVYSWVRNVQMSLSEGVLVSDLPLYYPERGNVDFIAYYPYSPLVRLMDLTDSLYVELHSQADGLPTEMLFSNNVTNQVPTESPVMLNFSYLLAKLEITVTGSANSTLTPADFAAMTASIDGLSTSGFFLLDDASYRDWSWNNRSITLYKTGSTATSATFEALVSPTNFSIGTFLFHVNGISYRHEQTVKYASANLYKLNFALDLPQTKAILLNTYISPRYENPSQNFVVNTTGTKNKLSDNICTLCSLNSIHSIGDIFFGTSQIVTPNGDGINDVFMIFSDISLNGSIIFYDRNNNEVAVAGVSNNWQGWDCNRESGLYSYKLTISDLEFLGLFIIVNDFDDYVDVSIDELECSKDCLQDFLLDPALYLDR